MKEDIYIPILNIPISGIIFGELMIFSGDIYYGLILYIFNLLAIIFKIIFSPLEIKIKNILQSLTLLIILRMISISMPQFFSNPINQYPLIYGIMFIPIYSTIKNQQISLKELGIDFRKLYIYLPIALVIGSIIAIIEYMILDPVTLIDDIRLLDIVFLIIIMFIFVGLIEEIIFRSILQTRIEKVLGSKSSILLNGILFGIMHASYGIVNEILFASVFGIVLGYIFYKTRSLPFIVSMHGGANVLLYGILPKLI